MGFASTKSIQATSSDAPTLLALGQVGMLCKFWSTNLEDKNGYLKTQ